MNSYVGESLEDYLNRIGKKFQDNLERNYNEPFERFIKRNHPLEMLYGHNQYHFKKLRQNPKDILKYLNKPKKPKKEIFVFRMFGFGITITNS